MKIFLTLVTILAIAPLASARLSKEQKITYHVELKDWPKSLKPTIEQAVNTLMTPDQCWTYNGKTKISYAIDYESKDHCSLFQAYKDDTKLIESKKNVTDVKYVITFENKKNGVMKLQLFKGDGKKLVSAAMTSFPLKKTETADSLKDRIVNWSMK